MEAFFSGLVWYLGLFWLIGVAIIATLGLFVWLAQRRFRRNFPNFPVRINNQFLFRSGLFRPAMVPQLITLAPLILVAPIFLSFVLMLTLPFLMLIAASMAFLFFRARLTGAPGPTFTYTRVFTRTFPAQTAPTPNNPPQIQLPPRGEVIDI